MQPSYEPISRLVRRQDDLCVSVVPTGSEATIFSKGAVDPIRDHRYAIVSTHSAVIAAASLLRSLWIFRPVKVVWFPAHSTIQKRRTVLSITIKMRSRYLRMYKTSSDLNRIAGAGNMASINRYFIQGISSVFLSSLVSALRVCTSISHRSPGQP